MVGMISASRALVGQVLTTRLVGVEVCEVIAHIVYGLVILGGVASTNEGIVIAARIRPRYA